MAKKLRRGETGKIGYRMEGLRSTKKGEILRLLECFRTESRVGWVNIAEKLRIIQRKLRK